MMHNRLKRMGVVVIALFSLMAIRPAVSSAQFEPQTATDLSPEHVIANQPSVSFIPNLGQTDARVRFYAQAGGTNVFFTDEGVVLAIPSAASILQPAAVTSGNIDPQAQPLFDTHAETMTWQLTGVRFEGANKAPVVTGSNQLPEVTNYMLGSDTQQWVTDIPTYGEIEYRNLFNGIDVSYERSAGTLKSTYTVAPGADPAQLRWSYPGSSAARLDPDGSLHVPITGAVVAELVERAPITWQDSGGKKVPVASSYAINSDGTIGFTLGHYDPTLPLIIDPTLEFNAWFDLSLGESIDIAVDSTNTFYVTGGTSSVAFPTTSNPYQGTLKGQYDAFITRYQNNTRIYSTYLGGIGTDFGQSIVANGSIVYVTGYASDGFPMPTGVPGYDRTYNGGLGDVFVVRLDTAVTGTSALQYSTYYGGTSADYGLSIVINGSDAMVLGVTTSSGITGMNGYDTSYNGTTDEDFLILRVPTTNSTLGYASYLGTSSRDFSGDIATIPGTNTVYVVGSTSSAAWPTVLAYNSVKQGLSDAVYARIDTGTLGSASLRASSYLGGSAGEGVGVGGIAVTVGDDGRVYIAGSTSSSNFPGTSNPTAYDGSYNGGGDVFLAQMNISDTANGSILYATYLGGSGSEEVTDIAVESSSRVTLVGRTKSTNFPSVNAASMQEAYGGGTNADGYVAQFNPINVINGPTQALAFSMYVGGSAYDSINGVAVGSNSKIYIAGRTISTIMGSLINPYSGAGFTQVITPYPYEATSYYMGSTLPDLAYNLGCTQGQLDRYNPGRQDSLVMLFFGTPVIQGSAYGTNLFVPSYFTDTTSIGNAAKQFGKGYVECVSGGSDTNSKITMAIGTNNYNYQIPPSNDVTFNHGAAWATMVNDVDAYLASNSGYSSRVIAAGALNSEVDFNTPAATFDWIDGYESVNQRPLYTISDSSGCPQSVNTGISGTCNNGWTQEALYNLTKLPSFALPQQYATDGASARQWQQIARYASLAKGVDLDFKGALTQKQACDQKGTCVANRRNTPSQGWLLFRDELNTDALTYQNVFWSSDMKWQFP